MDEWLDDDDNLSKWEDNLLTASDRRILLATWYFRACKKALQGGVRRLVKLFATSLGQQRLRQIEEEAKLSESRSRSMCR